MKKIIYSVSAAVLLTMAAKAQNAIPNGNMESWATFSYDSPLYYTNSNTSTIFQCNSPFNCIKTTDAYHGSYALQLTTNSGNLGTCIGYLLNANPGGNNPCTWIGGIPYNQKPTGLNGYYKSNVMTGDTAGLLVSFKQGGTCLGTYMIQFYGVHNTYTPFTLNFTSALSATPDSMIFAAVSSDVFNNIQIPGSTLQLDYLSFTGAVSQPTYFNGDFELWQNQTTNKLNNWYMNTDGMGNGVYQTTDKEAGNYAAELKTYSSNNESNYVARGGSISTGYYPSNCNGACNLQGGYPFINEKDTLCFFYKYAPAGNDSANVSMSFKKAGNFVWFLGQNYHSTVSTYSYVEIPFNTGIPIDSVIVSFQSSVSRDTTLNYVGSDFKVDEVHFKSQSLAMGIKLFDANTGIHVYPNPSNDGAFMLSNINAFDLVRVYNVYGQEVNAQISKQADYAKIQINAPGAYFVQVNASGKITTQKIIVSN